jgi:hypothetical protein
LDEHQPARLRRLPPRRESLLPELTERQASQAAELRCVSKTIRRQADQALETLALLLINHGQSTALPISTERGMAPQPPRTAGEAWQAELRAFLQLPPGGRVDIVCSEIPPEERPAYAEPSDRNYLRYAKFADLDSLIYVRSQLAQTWPTLHASCGSRASWGGLERPTP